MLWAILDLSQYLFRVSAASLRGNSGECGVWSLCRVAYVCHPAGWLADLKGVTACLRTLPHCRRSESVAEDQGTVSPVVATGWWARPNSSYAYQCVAAPLVSPA